MGMFTISAVSTPENTVSAPIISSIRPQSTGYALQYQQCHSLKILNILHNPSVSTVKILLTALYRTAVTLALINE